MNVLVADDNEVMRGIITDYLAEDENINVVGVLENGIDVVKTIMENDVDVLILDMLMPKKDGMSVIEELNILGMIKKDVHCIVLTAAGEENICKRAFELGVEYIMLKPFDLRDMKKRVCDIGVKLKFSYVDILNQHENNDAFLEKRISKMLNDIGFAPNLRGYKYIKSAILMCYKDESCLDSITKVIYPKIASQKHTCEAQVERAIRSAIETTWEKNSGEGFYRVLGNINAKKGGRPTNSEFIAYMVENLKGLCAN